MDIGNFINLCPCWDMVWNIYIYLPLGKWEEGYPMRNANCIQQGFDTIISSKLIGYHDKAFSCVEDGKFLGWYFVTNQKYSTSCSGMVCSREGIHGKMESMVPTAPSHLGRTSLMFSRWRTRLVATFISLPLACTRLPEALEASKSQAVLSFPYHSPLLPAISQSWLVIGSRWIIQ